MAYIIHICGIDGSGKTSLARNCSKRLEREGESSRVLYLGGLHIFSFAIFPFMKAGRLLGVPLEQHRFLPVRRLVWPWTFLFAYSSYFLLKTRMLSWLRRPGYLFFDRYALDAIVEVWSDLGTERPLDSLALRMISSFPAPNLRIYLDIDEELALARKADEIHSISWLRERRARFIAIAMERNYFRMDGSRPLHELVSSLLSLIRSRQEK